MEAAAAGRKRIFPWCRRPAVQCTTFLLWSTVEFEFQECDEYAARDGLIMDITTNFQKMLWTIETLRA